MDVIKISKAIGKTEEMYEKEQNFIYVNSCKY